jgi:biopolymer transport protein ExbD
MELRRKKRYQAEVSTASMNDIMFFLMLFFLIVSTLLNPSVMKLYLPNSKQAGKISKQKITISVTQDLEYYVNSNKMPFDRLADTLEALAPTSDSAIILRCDTGVNVKNLVKILEIGNDLQLKMVLATRTKNESKK